MIYLSFYLPHLSKQAWSVALQLHAAEQDATKRPRPKKMAEENFMIVL